MKRSSEYKKIIQLIHKYHRFLISTHVNPDPDALCSELAMAIFLRSLGKHVVIVNAEEPPDRFRFLPSIEHIHAYKKGEIIPFEVAITVDCGELSRIGEVREIITEDKLVINIDHHVTNDNFGNFYLIDVAASSTTEVLYHLFEKARCPLTKNLALLLYVGIMTDTGSFRYENTTSCTHKIAGDLMKFQFPVDVLYRRMYETIPLNDLKLFTKVLNGFESIWDGKVICVRLPRKVCEQFSDRFDLRDAIFRFLRTIRESELVVVFTEVSRTTTRVNFRSSGKWDVASLASVFKGGGHRRASGCTVEKNIQEARRSILQIIKKTLID